MCFFAFATPLVVPVDQFVSFQIPVGHDPEYFVLLLAHLHRWKRQNWLCLDSRQGLLLHQLASGNVAICWSTSAGGHFAGGKTDFSPFPFSSFYFPVPDPNQRLPVSLFHLANRFLQF